jgi:Tol biopolymer transport system component
VTSSKQPTEKALPATNTPIVFLKPQITYIRVYAEQNFSEFYTVDILCMLLDQVCFRKPQLLFTSLVMPNPQKKMPKGLLSDYSWSSDGNGLVLVSAGDIMLGNMSSQSWINLTNSPSVDEYAPVWSPNGMHIYFLSCKEGAEGFKTCSLARTDASGKNFMFLFSPQAGINDYAISPDENIVVFSQPNGIGNDWLYQTSLDGKNIRQITMGDFSENSPSFSPDGKKIVFVRTNRLNQSTSSQIETDIIIKDISSGNELNLTKSIPDEPASPRFSPDGQMVIFYAFNTNLKTNIYLVSSSGGETLFRVTQDNEEAALPDWRNYYDYKFK